MMADKFRKRAIVVEAMQYQPGKVKEIWDWAGMEVVHDPLDDQPAFAVVDGDDGRHNYVDILPGDWIIKGALGEFYPCSAEVFALTYEVVLSGKQRGKTWEDLPAELRPNPLPTDPR